MVSKRNIIQLFLTLITIGLILVVIVLSYLLIQRNKTIILPKPAGPFTVGRVGYDWVDNSRNETFSESSTAEKRKLSVWIWYPSDLKQNAKKSEYLPGKWETVQEKDSGIQSYLQQNFRTIHANSFQNVPLSTKRNTYPLIVFEPGLGDIVFNYQTLAENLASQGYIVVGINPTYSSRYVVFSDGSVAYRTPEGTIPESSLTDEQLNNIGTRLINTWTEDMRFAINKAGEMNTKQGSMWAEHIDMEHIGAFGHSFGGAASAEACLYDNRVKAGIDIDGSLHGDVLKKSPNKPFMFIMSQFKQSGIGLMESNKIKGFYNGIEKDGYLLEISNAAHYSFLDNTVFFSPVLKAMGVFGTINGERSLQITNSYITAFFDKYLKNMDSNLLKQKSSDYPEVTIQFK